MPDQNYLMTTEVIDKLREANLKCQYPENNIGQYPENNAERKQCIITLVERFLIHKGGVRIDTSDWI